MPPTNLAFNGGATFAGATSSASFAVTGSTTISSNCNAEGTVSLGNSTLAALTVLGASSLQGTTLAGATSTSLAVTGSSTISSVLNVGGTLNANGALSVAGNTTLAQATTTNLAITNTASCSGSSALTTNAQGSVICSALTGFDTFAYPFPLSATSSLLTFTGGVIVNAASSTITNLSVVNSTTTNATTTTLAITGVTSSLLKTLSDGAVVAAVPGTDYDTFAYLFPSNATNTNLAFNGGATFAGATSSASFAVTGSTTISSNFNAEGTVSLGNSTLAALTVLGASSLQGTTL